MEDPIELQNVLSYHRPESATHQRAVKFEAQISSARFPQLTNAINQSNRKFTRMIHKKRSIGASRRHSNNNKPLHKSNNR